MRRTLGDGEAVLLAIVVFLGGAALLRVASRDGRRHSFLRPVLGRR